MKKYFWIIAVVFALTSAACGVKKPVEAPSVDAAETASETEDDTQEGDSTPEESTQEPVEETSGEAVKETPGEPAEEGLILTSAPVLYLSDMLSSTWNRTELHSGNYSWSYMEKGETVSMVACGTHPLDENSGGQDKLKLPEYNGIDFVSYAVSCDVSPDRIVIREWDASEEGNIQAEPDSETVCEETLFADLKPDKIYEITAEWKEELLEERGFCGEASYELRTE